MCLALEDIHVVGPDTVGASAGQCLHQHKR